MEFEQALNKAAELCARQEKCVFDIQNKLKQWKVNPDDMDRIIGRLIQEKFIDEERYIRFFIRDKFKFNNWGKIKIKWQLKAKNIGGTVVDENLNYINQQDYQDSLKNILNQKAKQLNDDDPYKRRNKLLQHAYSKGFETDLIIKILDEIEK